MLTPDRISKLPPELRKAWEQRAMGIGEVSLEQSLTWGLQVVEERDVDKVFAENVHRLQRERIVTAEATIATLTRERNEARKWVKILHENGTFGRSCATALAEDGQLGDILLAADQLERSKAVNNGG